MDWALVAILSFWTLGMIHAVELCSCKKDEVKIIIGIYTLLGILVGILIKFVV